MATRDRPTEFGGRVQRNGIQPPRTPAGTPGHVQLTAAEKLMLQYRTGQTEDSTVPPDSGEAFTGIEPIAVAREKAPKPELYRESMAD